MCDKRFSDSSNLARHVRAVHEKMKPHKCSDCGKAFAEAAKLSDHKLTHSGVKPHSCDMCDAKFTLKHHLSPSTGHVFQVLRDEPNVGFGSNRTWASVPGKSGYGSGRVFLSSFSALHRTSLSRWKGVGLSLNFLTYSPTRIEKLLFYPCG